MKEGEEMAIQPEKEKLQDYNFRKSRPNKSMTKSQRLVAFFSKVNWISNLSIILLLIALCAILFLRPEPAKVSDYLKVIAVLTGLSATLIANSGISKNAGTPEQQKADKRLALVLAGMTAFITICSVILTSK